MAHGNCKEEREAKEASKQEVVFSRPSKAQEVFTEDNKKKFDELPGWTRHLVKRLVDHGNLTRAAEEAGVSHYVSKNISKDLAEKRSIVEIMNQGGLTTPALISHLVECLEANSFKFDKHMNPVKGVDLNLKLRTLELIFKLRGDFIQTKEVPKNIEELFADTEVS